MKLLSDRTRKALARWWDVWACWIVGALILAVLGLVCGLYGCSGTQKVLTGGGDANVVQTNDQYFSFSRNQIIMGGKVMASALCLGGFLLFWPKHVTFYNIALALVFGAGAVLVWLPAILSLGD